MSDMKVLVTAPVKIGRIVYTLGQVAIVKEKIGQSLLSLGVARPVTRAPEGPPADTMITRAQVTK